MIRINLHPVRQIKKAQAGKRQVVLFAVLVLGELASLMLVYSWKAGLLDAKHAVVTSLQAQVEQLKRQVGDFDQLKSQRDQLVAQRNIINTLQRERSGPIWMMRELSEILTLGKGPTVDQTAYEMLLRRDPNAGFNPRWNPNRLWIESFVEKDKLVTITGKAKDYDDVAEFSKRISLSRYFSNEFLERNDSMTDGQLGLKVVRFVLTCRASY